MSSVMLCSKCGAPLLTGALGNRCPRCLVQLGLDLGIELTPPAGERGTPDSTPGSGRIFGDYELLEQLGHGGMGVVYRARQRSLHRIVAVKMISPGWLGRPELVQRFHSEAEAIAQLQHPNIVAIHEVGEHDGRLFFSMDYIPGRTLAELVRDGALPAKRAAGYLQAIAQAVHCAHEHGILHRDLKPSNVLIDAADQPRITDFGLAKRLSGGTTDLTLPGQVLGSPNYLSPEQAAGRNAAVGPASDVYALGAMLYHLLTGRPPFQAESLPVLLRQVMEAEPVAPRTLNPSLPRDLETICLKCLEKEPARRYATAQALANELGRFREQKPILARPVSVASRTARWCRRRPVRASLIGALMTVTLAGFLGVLWQWRATDRARVRTEQEHYDASIAEAQLLIEQNRFDRARELLMRPGQERHRGWEWGWLQRQCNLDLMTLQHPAAVMALAFSPDGQTLAAGGYDNRVTLWQIATGRRGPVLLGHTQRIWSLAFSPDGRRLVTSSVDTSVRIWDTETGAPLLTLPHTSGVFEAAFSPDGRTIATAAIYSGALLWDAETGTLLPKQPPHDQAVVSIAFSPDGGRLACGGGRWALNEDTDTTIGIFDRASLEPLVRFTAHRQTVQRLRFSPDGSLLASASGDGTVKLWNAQTGAEVRALQIPQPADSMIGLDFSPDGRWLAVSGLGWTSGKAHLLEVATGQVRHSLEGHAIGVPAVQFSPDGKRLATAGMDRTARVWLAGQLQEFLSLEGHDHAVWTVAFSRDGRRVASGSLDQTARVWDAASGDLLATLAVGFPVVSLAWSPDGTRLATVGPTNTACIWKVRATIEPRSSRREEAQTSSSSIRPPASDNDASLLTSAATSQEPVRLHGHTGAVLAVAWSPDERFVLTGGKDGTTRLWDAAAGIPLRTNLAHTNGVLAVAFSPDGRRIATGGAEPVVRLWDTASGTLLKVLPGHGILVQQVSFSPDGSLIATGSSDRKAHVFEAETGRLKCVLEGHRNGISSLAFTPDGTRLVTASAGFNLASVGTYEQAVLIWDVRTGERLLQLNAHQNWAVAVAFSPDGQRLATGSADNTIRIREAFPWQPEDYATETGASLANRIESHKRRLREVQLQSPFGAAALDARVVRPGRRLETYYGARIECNLAAQPGARTRPNHPIPPRDPRTDPRCLDLSASYNLALSETWPSILGLDAVDHSLANFLPDLPGLRMVSGVPFDVRGIILLRSTGWACAPLPAQVEIAVGRKFRQLHVLHSSAARALEDLPLGVYRLHYRDGGAHDLAIINARDLRDAWVSSRTITESAKARAQARDAEVAWLTPTKPGAPGVRLYHRTYENPEPGREVASITFESAVTTGAPFLLALTVEP